MKLKNLVIKKNEEIKPSYFLMSFEDKEMASECVIGQFLELKAGEGLNNLIRKPISIDNVVGDEISVVYRVVGKGTKALSEMRAGEEISVLGPLGNGFPVDIADDTEIILVAGGIGIGPFPFVMDKYENWKLFYGFRNINEFVFSDEFKAFEAQGKAQFATDDGSYGTKGYVTDILENYLKTTSHKKVIFCCGPNIMMRKVCDIAIKYNVESFISMEDYMGCGIGICVGCVRKIKNPDKPNGWEHKKVCKDGPIFKGDEIIWE